MSEIYTIKDPEDESMFITVYQDLYDDEGDFSIIGNGSTAEKAQHDALKNFADKYKKTEEFIVDFKELLEDFFGDRNDARTESLQLEQKMIPCDVNIDGVEFKEFGHVFYHQEENTWHRHPSAGGMWFGVNRSDDE